jgi:hypothetical protein
MSYVKTSRRASCLIVLAVGLCLVGAPGPEGTKAQAEPAKGKEAPPSKSKRIVYVVKYGSAKGMAALLGKHFQGEVEVEVVPDVASNCLLIRAAPAAFGEVVKLLAQLDRRPQTVAVELLIVEAPAKGAKPGAGRKELDEKELTGPVSDVVSRLEGLQKTGEVGGLKRIQLTAVEHQPASALLGEMRAVVSGVRVLGGGQVSRSIVYRNVGTSVKLTPRVAPGNKVLIDLDVSEARAFVPEDGVVLGKDEKGQEVRATEFVSDKLVTTLEVPSGHAVFARGVKTTAKAGQPRTVILVAARILGAEAKAEKEARPKGPSR